MRRLSQAERGILQWSLSGISHFGGGGGALRVGVGPPAPFLSPPGPLPPSVPPPSRPAAAPPVIAFHAHDDECERRFEPHFAVARYRPVHKCGGEVAEENAQSSALRLSYKLSKGNSRMS